MVKIDSWNACFPYYWILLSIFIIRNLCSYYWKTFIFLSITRYWSSKQWQYCRLPSYRLMIDWKFNWIYSIKSRSFSRNCYTRILLKSYRKTEIVIYVRRTTTYSSIINNCNWANWSKQLNFHDRQLKHQFKPALIKPTNK